MGFNSLQSTAYDILSDEPGAYLERERPGWFLTMKREANNSLTLEARNQSGPVVLLESISTDEFEAALRDRSQFVQVIRRAVDVLIRRIPVTIIEGRPGISIDLAGNPITTNLGDRLRAAAKRIRGIEDNTPMTEGEQLLETAGRRSGKSSIALEWIEGPAGFSRGITLDGISGVSKSPQPDQLLPRPARVYCED